QEVRALLDDVERANLASHGYGSHAFARNLRQTYIQLAEREPDEEELAAVEALGHRIREEPLQLIDGVSETLAELAGRHELLLLTKGHVDERLVKVEASGLREHFADVVWWRRRRSPSTARSWRSTGWTPNGPGWSATHLAP